MKRLFVLAVAFVLCSIVGVQAAGDEKNGHAYFTKAQLPNMANILPAPPEFESARFVADQSQYLWGKLMRLDEARCAMAQRDAVYSMETIIEEFSGIFGLEIRNHERFIGQLARARAEFAEKTGGMSNVINNTNDKQGEGSALIYHIDGTPANNAKGVVIAKGQKVARR